MIEKFENKGIIYSLIIRSDYVPMDIDFITPNNYSQQLGIMARPAGYVISPHTHNAITREVEYTKEVLFIRAGKVRVDFYTEDCEYLESTILKKGDVILLAYGGHGFNMIEDSEIIEVKQGPYAGDGDKTHFNQKLPSKLIFKNEKYSI